jgi:tryptophan-rich sensory protein
MIGLAMALALKQSHFIFWIIPCIHLLLNLSFSPIVFGLHNLLLGGIVVSLILTMAILTTLQFYFFNNNLTALLLMIPYIIWLCFANYLQWSLYKINNV